MEQGLIPGGQGEEATKLIPFAIGCLIIAILPVFFAVAMVCEQPIVKFASWIGLVDFCNWEDSSTTSGGSSTNANVVEGLENIPESLADVFREAGVKYNVHPAFVAAIFWKEHGEKWQTSGPWATSSSGANGPFQYLECSWEGWNQPGCTDKDGNPADGTFSQDLSFIAKYGGYGKDGDGDGKADVQSLPDSAHAAASHLAANGAPTEYYTDWTLSDEKIKDVAALYNSGGKWGSSKCQSSVECVEYAQAVLDAYKILLHVMGSG